VSAPPERHPVQLTAPRVHGRATPLFARFLLGRPLLMTT
jgi:hypothetical protein